MFCCFTIILFNGGNNGFLTFDFFSLSPQSGEPSCFGFPDRRWLPSPESALLASNCTLLSSTIMTYCCIGSSRSRNNWGYFLANPVENSRFIDLLACGNSGKGASSRLWLIWKSSLELELAYIGTKTLLFEASILLRHGLLGACNWTSLKERSLLWFMRYVNRLVI